MSTIVTIASGDLISTSRTDINTNFSNLNTDKFESSNIDTDTTLATNSDTKVASQKATKAYVDTLGNVNASTTLKGIVEEATGAEVQVGTGAGGTSARLFVNPSTLQYGIKFFFNPFLTTNVTGFYSDVVAYIYGNSTTVRFEIPGSVSQQRLITSDYADADACQGAALIGSYLYLLLADAGASGAKVYRYDKTDLASGGTLMTLSGQTLGTSTTNTQMAVDPNGVFYFTCKANNSTSQHIISSYTLSGTTLTYVGDVTCGSTSGNFDRFIWVDSSTNYYGKANADSLIRKYNSAGTLSSTGTVAYTSGFAMVLINAVTYMGTTAGYVQVTLP